MAENKIYQKLLNINSMHITIEYKINTVVLHALFILLFCTLYLDIMMVIMKVVPYVCLVVLI